MALHPIALHLKLVQNEWGMTHAQMASLLHVSEGEFERWLELSAERDPASVPRGMETVPPLLMIHRRLKAKFEKVEDQARWLTTANADFGDNPPLDIAASSVENLNWLAYYVESAWATAR